jgi:hypothetical protein
MRFVLYTQELINRTRSLAGRSDGGGRICLGVDSRGSSNCVGGGSDHCHTLSGADWTLRQMKPSARAEGTQQACINTRRTSTVAAATAAA